MDATQFRATLANLGFSQQAFGRIASVDPRTVQRWALGERDIPGTVETILEFLAALTIAPPPQGSHTSHDRDEPCAEAIEPHLGSLMRRASAVGWTKPEIVAAVLGWAIHTTIESAGADAIICVYDTKES